MTWVVAGVVFHKAMASMTTVGHPRTHGFLAPIEVFLLYWAPSSIKSGASSDHSGPGEEEWCFPL